MVGWTRRDRGCGAGVVQARRGGRPTGCSPRSRDHQRCRLGVGLESQGSRSRPGPSRL